MCDCSCLAHGQNITGWNDLEKNAQCLYSMYVCVCVCVYNCNGVSKGMIRSEVCVQWNVKRSVSERVCVCVCVRV